MIHIEIDKKKELQDWYAAQLLPVIQGKKCHEYSGKRLTVRRFRKQFAELTGAEIRDILLMRQREIEAKYPWIEEYICLCDFCAFYAEFRMKSRNHSRSELVRLRSDYLNRYGCRYLDEALDECRMDPADAAGAWNRLERLLRTARRFLEELNEIIRSKIDYTLMGEAVKGALVERLDIPVCPYCNKQYIQPVTIGHKKKYLGDIDHIRPKSVYQLFSLSLWNLTPSCKSCNQLFKGTHATKLLNPWEAGFGDDCILELKYWDVQAIVGLNKNMNMKWTVAPESDEETQQLIGNNIRLFYLDESYAYHKKDIQTALRKRYLLESRGYQKSLEKMNLSVANWSNQMLYGVSLDESKFQEELLSKAIYDAVRKN